MSLYLSRVAKSLEPYANQLNNRRLLNNSYIRFLAPKPHCKKIECSNAIFRFGSMNML